MALFTALAAGAALAIGAGSAYGQRKAAEGAASDQKAAIKKQIKEAKKEARKQDNIVKNDAKLRAKRSIDNKFKIGVDDKVTGTSGSGRGSSKGTNRKSSTGVGGFEVSASRIGGL